MRGFLQDAVKAVDATANGNLVGAGVGVALTFAKILKVGEKIYEVAKKYSLKTDCRLSCFVAGTLILTKDGFVPIETLQAGDIVLAHDPDTGETALKPIVRTYINTNDSVWELALEKEGETYLHEVTASHPYYVIGQGWVEVGNLQQGQLIETQDGKPAKVTSLKDTGVVTTTYNFEVKDIHTYYVSAATVLVHNCGGKVNGNSKASTNQQHVYMIQDADGNIKKIGVSGQDLNKNGTSGRANSQLQDGDTAKVLERGIPGRAAVLQKEGQLVEGLREAGHELPDNLRPKI